jgi:hypothetical protein
MFDERRQLLAQPRGVLLAEVDLVLHAAYPEMQGLVGRAAIKIVLKYHDGLSCHPNPPMSAMGRLPCSGQHSFPPMDGLHRSSEKW